MHPDTRMQPHALFFGRNPSVKAVAYK